MVSIPCFLNVDTEYPQEGWEESLDIFLKAVQAEKPDLVLIPGDLVMGHWDRTSEGIDFWADKYYSLFKKRLEAFGFNYLVTIGDHEIGDNSWPPIKASKVPLFKQAFVRNFSTPDNGPEDYIGTSYFSIQGNILFVMIDCFQSILKKGNESCVVNIEEKQLEWLEEVIDRYSSVDHIVVAGHVPVLTPVRHFSSSNLSLEGGENSGFWKLLKEKKVDFYLCGEVHDVTCKFDMPIIQISHGGLFGYNNRVNYLLMKFKGENVHCQVKEFNLDCFGGKLWQTGENRPFKDIRIDVQSFIKGELIISKRGSKKKIVFEEGILSKGENTKEQIAEDQIKNAEYILKKFNRKMNIEEYEKILKKR